MVPELLARIARALEARALPYMVIGGQAVLVHGEPRLTKDIDITLGRGLDALPEVLEAVSEASLEPLVDPEDFTRRTLVLPSLDRASGLRVDLVLSRSPYEREAIGRALRRVIAGHEVAFATAEDLIIHKVIAGRPRDLEDVRGVLLKNPGLDHELVRRTLREFEAALDEPFLARLDEAARP